jgi:diadenosine tetraphosphate (Ap4A) HIT family hydrolase
MVCMTLAGTAEDEFVLRTERWAAHAVLEVPGWIMFYPIRHSEGVWQFDAAEAAEYGPLLVEITSAIKRSTDAERVYVIHQGEVAPHFHNLLMARGPEVPGGLRATLPLLEAAEQFSDPVSALRVARDIRTLLDHDPV